MSDPPVDLTRALGDRYAIERGIGRGGAATVYLARDLRHERTVALKVLEPEIAASVGARRFLREVRIAAALRHPNIQPLYDSGEAAGFLYYVMPYEEGKSLRERLRREGALPVDEAIRVLRDVAEALSYAHEQGIVHRDIKPDNVLLSGRHAVVTDFGIAKALGDAPAGSTVTTTGVALGTPAYMAPEQALAEPTVDHRADIYAFGVLAYELLAGEPPFTGPDQVVVTAHVTRPAPDVSTLRPTVPEELAALIARCLEKRPADRWQRAEDMLPVLEGVATPASGVGPVTAARPGHRRARLVTGAVGVLAVLAVIAVVLARRSTDLSGGGVATRVAVAPLENRTGVDSLGVLGDVAAEMITNGLMRAGIGNVAPTQTVLAAGMGGEQEHPGERTRAIARETRAGLVVTGAYSRRGDSLAFQAQVVDPAQDRVVAPVQAVVVPGSDPARGFQVLGERIAVVLSAELDSPLKGMVAVSDLPMSMAAYRPYMRGVEEVLRADPAAEDLRQAVALDSAAVEPHLWLGIALGAQVLQGLPADEATRYEAGADSALRWVRARKASLAPFDLAAYEWWTARQSGDAEGALRAGRRLADMGWGFPGAEAAAALNRFDEALDLVEADLSRPSRRKVVFAWALAANLLHRKGDHERELAEVRAMIRETGEGPYSLWLEARALAAMGRVPELRETLESLHALSSATPWLLDAALDLRAHGWSAAADTVGRQVITWYRDGVGTPPSPRARMLLAVAEFYFGDADQARRLFEELAAEPATRREPSGFLGIDAARRKDEVAANRMIDRVGAMAGPGGGRQELWQARIAAQLGDCRRAVGFLRQGQQKGGERRLEALSLYEDPQLSKLRGCPEYDAFMAPKG